MVKYKLIIEYYQKGNNNSQIATLCGCSRTVVWEVLNRFNKIETIFADIQRMSEEENDVYYIGDSKYYKIGSDPKGEAVYKQYTYARNVIQWNLNLFLDEKSKDSEKDRYKNIRLRDDITEGYNVIPNFFVSANINPATLSYEDKTEEHKKQPPISRHFSSREMR